MFNRETEQSIAHRSTVPDDINEWLPGTVCLPVKGRHVLDAAALDNGRLYVVSMLTTDGLLYGNNYDGGEWGDDPVLIADDVTTVASDDRRLSIEFDASRKRLHLVYVDARNILRYRFLDSPYRPEDWHPGHSNPGLELASGVFTCALSIDTSARPHELMITYGVEKYAGRDKRERTGELYARRYSGERWLGNVYLMSRPGTILNWYPNVNRDISHGICMMYSRSVNRDNPGQPLAVMVGIRRFGGD